MPKIFDYSLDVTTLPCLQIASDLGLLFTFCLSFDGHIDHLITKFNAKLGFINRWCREFDDPYVTKVLYCMLLKPLLEYVSPVYDLYYETYIDPIKYIQRKFFKLAFRRLSWEYQVYLPHYENKLKVISLVSRRKTFKIV